MIQAIILDYGGVLVDHTDDAMASLAQSMQIDIVVLKNAVYGIDRARWQQTRIGLLSEAEHWAQAQQVLGCSAEQVAAIKRALYEEVQVRPQFLDYLKSLQGQVKFAILSNAIPCFSQTWQVLGFHTLCAVMINSAVVRLAKPDPAIYTLTLKCLGLPAEACIFIDDQLKNVEAAEKLGIHGIVYLHEQQAIEAVQRLLAANP